MSLKKSLRYLYKEHLKRIRDRRGKDAYIRNQGKAEGKAEAVLLLLREKGDVPRKVSERVMSKKDANVLEDWLKAASRTGN